MRQGECGARDEGRGLWWKGCGGVWGDEGCREGTVGKGMQGGDWKKGCREGTVEKGMQGGR